MYDLWLYELVVHLKVPSFNYMFNWEEKKEFLENTLIACVIISLGIVAAILLLVFIY
jgi:hypothetical protein